jgi:choline/glycine/proline betaine transport protein
MDMTERTPTPSPAPTPDAPPAAPARMTFSAPVVVPALLTLGLVLVYCALWPQQADRVFSSAQAWVTLNLSWFYTTAVTFFLVFLLLIAFSRFGDIRLGPDDAKPEFSFISWAAMLFAAGMGIGLMYFGVGEPLQHYLKPPTEIGGTPMAAREAMSSTFFHWGLHAWAIYGVMGLVLAYFGFRYNLPLTLRSGLYPIFKARIHGPLGHGVDAFALVGTIAGIATTLGYGALQLAAGFHILTGWDTGTTVFRIVLITVVVGMAGLSAASGLNKGLRRLSELNMALTVVLLGFVLLAGPTVHLFNALSENIGNYFSDVVSMSLRTFTYETSNDAGWFGGWTILYWAWWASWSPFVGMFIARISRGRTIREFIIGVLLVPTAFNLLWMTVFGNSAIWIDGHVAAGALGASVGNVDALLFRFFEYLPLAKATSWLAIVLIAMFFVTSADSGAFVVDSIATRGNPASPAWQRLFWAAVLGVTAIVLLLAGGLKALQAMTLVAAVPVVCIMLALCYGLWKGLQADRAHFETDLAPATNFWTGQHWRKRLEMIVHHNTNEDVRHFLHGKVLPGMREVQQELQRQGVQAQVHEDLGAQPEVRLTIPMPALRDFVYGVRSTPRAWPTFMARDERATQEQVYEPIVYFEDGRQGYDIQYLRQEEIIADILRQYERYLSLSASRDTRLLNRAPGHTDPI